MKPLYKTGRWTVDPINMSLLCDGQKQEIRPKTFCLLMVFLKNPQTILSKQTLLDSVWDDIVASDQVLFQTIRELRNLFPNADVIKTVPRKGYCWTLSVKEVVENQSQPENPETSTKAELEPTEMKVPDEAPHLRVYNKTKTVLLFTLTAVVFVMFTFHYLHNSKATDRLAGTVMVLPVKNNVIGNDHDWVPYGMMTQLTNSLVPSNQIAVADLNYTLSSLKLASVNSETNEDNIGRLFTVSGAAIVVDTELSGSIEDYRLAYNLHFENDVKRGVLFDRTTSGVVHELADIIAKYTRQDVNHSIRNSRQDFNNELLARALEYFESEQYGVAAELLSSLLMLQPDNALAQRLYAESMLLLGKFDEAEHALDTAIKLARTDNRPGLARLSFFRALTNFNKQLGKKQFDADLDQLVERAEHFAREENDWLYKAYLAELKSAIATNRQQLDAAIENAKQAQDYFDVVRCPIGRSRTLLSLAELYHQTGDEEASLKHNELANELIDRNQLNFLYKAKKPQITQ